MKALVTIECSEEEVRKLEDLGYEIILMEEKEAAFSEKIKDIEVLACFNPFDTLDISLLPNLKWIQLITAGINQVPVEKILNQKIILTNNRGGFSIPIAEWIVLKILEMIKNSKEYYKKQEKKIWEMEEGMLELHGKKIGFIGTGSIAMEAAKRLKNFGVEIIGINTSGRQVEHFHQCFSVDQLNDVLVEWDFIVITSPYTEETHRLINKDVFSNMKDGAYLVNIARGSIIDEEELINNLKTGKIRKAALDVFEVEPLPKDSPLWNMDNVILSPHGCWGSEMDAKRKFEIIYKNMAKYANKEKLVNIVDLERGY